MADEYIIEQALSDYQGSDGEPLTHTDLQIMLAELAELRRKAAVYDRLAQKAPSVLQVAEKVWQ